MKFHLPPLWVRWGIIAPTILTTLGILAYFGVDWEDITPATVQFVVEEDDKVEAAFDKGLMKVQTSLDIVVGNDAGRSIIRFYRALCDGRSSVDVSQLLDDNYRQYETARGRKHNFENKPFTEVCSILGIRQ